MNTVQRCFGRTENPCVGGSIPSLATTHLPPTFEKSPKVTGIKTFGLFCVLCHSPELFHRWGYAWGHPPYRRGIVLSSAFLSSGSDMTVPDQPHAVQGQKASEPRFRDIAFVVKLLKQPDRLGELKGWIDPTRIGISGHSYGGLPSQVVAGQFVKRFGYALAIPELQGAFILSPSPPRPSQGDTKDSFRNMPMPLFSVTGTEDEAPGRGFAAKDRRALFDHTSNVDQWLLILNGDTHFTFSGEETLFPVARLFPGMKPDPNLAANHEIIRAAATDRFRANTQTKTGSRRRSATAALERQRTRTGTSYLIGRSEFASFL
jgi:hypothetical protein